MVYAVLMAGGKTWAQRGQFEKFSISLHEKACELIYGEKYLWRDTYKPLILVGGVIDGKYELRPMISYPLDVLGNTKSIEQIVVVGEKNLIEASIKERLLGYDKQIEVIQQKDSFLNNALEGIKYCPEGHKLFMCCDVVSEKPENIDGFVERCEPLKEESDLLFPIICRETLKEYEKWFRRPYVWIKDDNPDQLYNEEVQIRKRGRRGFRIGAMLLADDAKIKNQIKIQRSYDLRKLYNPLNWLGLFSESPELISRYLISRFFVDKLKWSDINRIMSDYFDTRFRLVEIDDAATSLDVDSCEDHKNITTAIEEGNL